MAVACLKVGADQFPCSSHDRCPPAFQCVAHHCLRDPGPTVGSAGAAGQAMPPGPGSGSAGDTPLGPPNDASSTDATDAVREH